MSNAYQDFRSLADFGSLKQSDHSGRDGWCAEPRAGGFETRPYRNSYEQWASRLPKSGRLRKSGHTQPSAGDGSVVARHAGGSEIRSYDNVVGRKTALGHGSQRSSRKQAKGLCAPCGSFRPINTLVGAGLRPAQAYLLRDLSSHQTATDRRPRSFASRGVGNPTSAGDGSFVACHAGGSETRPYGNSYEKWASRLPKSGRLKKSEAILPAARDG